jgi:hypothetical protein
MKLSVLVVAACLGFALVGCQKDNTELVKVNGEGTGSEAAAPAAGGSTDATDLATTPDSSTSSDPTTPAARGGSTSSAPNPGGSAPALGTDAGMPSLSQEGRVTCEACKGTMPKEDAVTAGGKTLCMACAEEAKG